MRKRNCSFFFDTFIWWLASGLPLLMYLFGFIFGNSPIASVSDFFDTTLLASSDGIIFSTLSGVFGSNGIMPLFSSDLPLQFFSWFVSVHIIHLAVDFLLFIPRLCHEWIQSFTSGRGD